MSSTLHIGLVTILLVVAVALGDDTEGKGGDEPKQPERIPIVATVTHYAINGVSAPDLEETRLIKKATDDEIWDIDGIILKINEPKEFEGLVFTMHHDGVLASGDPRRLFPISAKFRMGVLRKDIGKMNYSECSIVPGGFKRIKDPEK